jgi:GAF domain-containing protein
MIETTKSFVARAGDSLLRSGTPPGPTPRRAIVALAVFVAALVLTLLLREWLPHTQFALFFAAIIAGTLTTGFAAGAVMTVASLVALHVLAYAGAEPAAGPLVLLVRYAVLGGVALGSALLVAALQRSISRVHARRLEAGVELAAARRAVDRARQLQSLSSRLLDAAGEAAVQRMVAVEVRTAVGAQAAAVVLPDTDGELCLGGWDGPADARSFADATFCHTPIGLDVLRGDEADLHVTPDGSTARGAGDTLNWVALPLRGQRCPIAVLALGFEQPIAFHPDQREFLTMAAQHGAQALERAYLYDSGLRGRIRAEFAERRLAFLAEASARLASSLDYESTLAALAHMCVPDLSEWCMVHLEDSGRPRLVAVAHADAAHATAWRTIEESSVAGAAATIPFARVLKTGEPELVAPVPDELLEKAAADDGQLTTLRSFGLAAQLVVPIGVDDRNFGTLTFVMDDSGRSLTTSTPRWPWNSGVVQGRQSKTPSSTPARTAPARPSPTSWPSCRTNCAHR